MKFGKQLQKRQLDIPEYATSFVNYKALKKLIKQLSTTPVLLAQNALQESEEGLDPQTALQANKATFFFRLERELEKVNACYLQKEAELKLRLKTLLDKKKAIEAKYRTSSQHSSSFVSLEEGFQSFGNDLNKLQQFVEVNATAFSKILKKWDKTSKSRTKELYLSRAVEVQPCFNREVISELSDQATTSLLELAAWAEGEKIDFNSHRASEHVVQSQFLGTEESDTDTQLQQAASSGNLSGLRDWVQRLLPAPDAAQRLTRTFLAAIAEAPLEAIKILLATEQVDVHAEDGINERNCLHEAAIAGRGTVLELCLAHNVDPSRIDVYGRLPLHYACMHGQVTMVQRLIDANPTTVNGLDHDNYTPLIHSIIRHQLSCVHTLLQSNARIDPASETEHAPLNLACQYGDIEVCELLLERGVTLMTDAEGLYPQHLVARKGHDPQLLSLLEKYGANLDQRDKLYQWTPLFHAASEGFVECVRILLEKKVDVSILDEKGLPAVYYAAWEGHLECMRLLISANNDSSEGYSSQASYKQAPPAPTKDIQASSEAYADGIPDLSLPPPIIPFRRYGHNFLDSKTFVQLTFEVNGTEAISFFNDSKYPAARLTVSSKSSDHIPRNVMIPIQEEFRTVSFQVDKLETFIIDFDIYPSFGSKVIARTVALPEMFSTISTGSGQCVLPLFDPRLRAIGRLKFSFLFIKPFQGIPLEISQFETYWKATSQIDTSPSTFITGSSLSGEYVQLFVQLTSDGVPVLYPRWNITLQGIRCSVNRISCKEFISLRNQSVLDRISSTDIGDLGQLHEALATSFLTLEEALHEIPTNKNLLVQILYPIPGDETGLNFVSPGINAFVDIILGVVFDHARQIRSKIPELMRSIAFASFNPSICLALNWKQPNFPVLLCNGLDAQFNDPKASRAAIRSSGRHSLSVKESVRIAQSNNLMGLVCTRSLLKTVSALVESIKVAGLVLVSDNTAEVGVETSPLRMDNSTTTSDGIDGVLRRNGVLGFNESIEM